MVRYRRGDLLVRQHQGSRCRRRGLLARRQHQGRRCRRHLLARRIETRRRRRRVHSQQDLIKREKKMHIHVMDYIRKGKHIAIDFLKKRTGHSAGRVTCNKQRSLKKHCCLPLLLSSSGNGALRSKGRLPSSSSSNGTLRSKAGM